MEARITKKEAKRITIEFTVNFENDMLSSEEAISRCVKEAGLIAKEYALSRCDKDSTPIKVKDKKLSSKG